MVEVAVKPRESDGARCAFCHDEVPARKGATCEGCGVRLHTHCQAELKACPTPGCAVVPSAAPPLRARRASWRFVPALLLAGVLGLLWMGLVAADAARRDRLHREQVARQEEDRRQDEARRAREREVAEAEAAAREVERRRAAEQRAEEARRRGQRLEAEAERRRAEAEQARAEAERVRAEAERARAEAEREVRELLPRVLAALAARDQPAVEALTHGQARATVDRMTVEWGTVQVGRAAGPDARGLVWVETEVTYDQVGRRTVGRLGLGFGRDEAGRWRLQEFR